MSMIERVAQAMCVSALGGRRCPCIESGQFNCRDTFPWDQAKAAIEAMKEPTRDMVEAGRSWAGVAFNSPDRTYQAMINAALEEKKDD